MALAHILLTNDYGISVVSTLELDLSLYTQSPVPEKLRAVANDVKILLATTV